MSHSFVQVDAFTRHALYGNPAAVVFEADDLASETMQQIAREMNLSETVFILRPTVSNADYRVRIFTPMSELPFAGHPTLAAASSVLTRFASLADVALLRQECGIGIVPVEVLRSAEGVLLRMTQAEPQHRAVPITRETIAKMLGCSPVDLADTPCEVVSTGVPWLIVELSRSDVISRLVPDQGLIATQCKAIGAAGVTVFVERGESAPARIRVRTFAPGEGVAEDPVCGSGNGSVAAFIARHKHAADSLGEYVAEQGVEIDRAGIVYASWTRQDGVVSVKIAGETAVAATGTLHV